MADYEDDQQVEALKKWWQENWKALAAGLVLGVSGILGWESWQSHQQQTAEAASRLYEDLSSAIEANNLDQAAELSDKLKNDYAASPYAAQAMLALARGLVENGDLEPAQERLNWVVQRTGEDGMRHIARLRRARVLWNLGRVDEALGLVKVTDAGSFTSLYAELRGDIRMSSGDRAAAHTDYQQAMDALPEGAANRELLQYKIDDLADAVNS